MGGLGLATLKYGYGASAGPEMLLGPLTGPEMLLWLLV